ncbi:MAG: hypothetical protein L3K04_00410 [Thermoplasmata archaeon]|jgi:hypothetical protein|nr:hypothetical protein [Thermoplasmata archaeon]MCI4338078.1 hypothetical protein [Thermoplasmata archaeon]MCI4340920.1 hypothetical protein [Thermoplasmata archaeon]
MSSGEGGSKRPAISLTQGSRVRVHSAGSREEPMVSVGVFRGLVSVGGENSLALELEAEKGEKERVRLVPLSAIFAIDILLAVKAEEEKRVDPGTASGYFR